ncbi:MAG: hypothetical protein SNJ84_08885 [Verrucomicrobiia bacterium]
MGPRRVVLGVGVAGYPEGGIGNSWIYLNWALAFRQLGWEVWLVEEVPGDRLQGPGGPMGLEQSAQAAHWRRMLDRFGLKGTLMAEGSSWPEDGSREFVAKADWLVNLSGHFKRWEQIRSVPRRVYVDLDPGFTQAWAQGYGVDMNLEGHTDFATVALGWNDPESRVPRDGREWLPVAPPVALDWWRYCPPASGRACWTTVTHWYGYPQIEWEGMVLDNKSSEFLKVAGLPERCAVRLRLATDLQPGWDDYHRMQERGWDLVPVREVCRDLESYGGFIEASAGEFSVAKGGYVVMNSGWFSDRTVCYLASGRPAVVQETGWSRHLPTGAGLAAFQDEGEAVRALAQQASDRDRSAEGARRLAEEFFDGRKVVAKLIKSVG